jgi:hypothetical protein
MVLKNTSEEAFKEIMLNLERMKADCHKEMKVIERQNENSAIWYTRMAFPNMPDRDMVMLCAFYPQPDGTSILNASSV